VAAQCDASAADQSAAPISAVPPQASAGPAAAVLASCGEKGYRFRALGPDAERLRELMLGRPFERAPDAPPRCPRDASLRLALFVRRRYACSCCWRLTRLRSCGPRLFGSSGMRFSSKVLSVSPGSKRCAERRRNREVTSRKWRHRLVAGNSANSDAWLGALRRRAFIL
jgi:hypothetical protein